jgi:hypothetical protein
MTTVEFSVHGDSIWLHTKRNDIATATHVLGRIPQHVAGVEVGQLKVLLESAFQAGRDSIAYDVLCTTPPQS